MPTSDLLKIQGPQSIPDIEAELTELDEQRPHRLLLPTKLTETAIGGQASLIQLILTWGTRHADTTLVTHIKSGEDPAGQLTKMAKQPFGFSAIWAADTVTDLSGERDLRVEANVCSEQQFAMMWRGQASRSGQQSLFGEGDPYFAPEVSGAGQQVFLACVDHDRWAIPQCYFADETLRGRDDFVALARASILRATKDTNASPVSPDLYGAFGAIFHELFRNTHEHARHDRNGALLRRSLRGMIVNRRAWTREKVESVVKEAPPLREFTQSQISGGRDDYVRWLEVSVFDSGIGLAAHWMRDQWSETTPVDQELAATEKCLQKWASASGQSHKGLGLHEVATMLTRLNGFMRIRSGCLSLYRDFNLNPVNEPITDFVKLFDWTTMTNSPTKMAPVAGTLFTLLIPIASR